MVESRDRPYAEFGKCLRALRLRANIVTQRELVDRLGDLGVHYSYTVVSHWESGRRCPPLETLVAIIRVLAEAGSVKSTKDANRLLHLANMRNLSEDEVTRVFDDLAAATVPESPTSVFGDESKLQKATIDSEAVGAFIPGAAPPPPTLMVGRGDAVAEMRFRLTGRTSTTLLTAVRGWPGIGKTTLAAALAHDTELKEAFPGGVLWAALGPGADPILPLGRWLMALGVNPGDLPTLEGRSSRMAALLRKRKMLLIVDDVWDAADARPLCVGGRDCRTLITTRHPEVARDLGLSDQAIYRLEVLADGDAMALLCELAPRAVDLDPAGTRQLVRELEGLPLALQVAGRLLAAEVAMGWGISDLLEELVEGTRILEEKAPADLTDLSSQTTPTVAVLLQKSTDRLDDVTRDRFALLGAFVPKPATFDGAAAAAVWEVEDPRPTLRVLADRGLLEPAPDGRFQMHALLTVHARALCGE